MKNILLLSAILLSVLFFSCKKDNNPADEPQKPSAEIVINVSDVVLPDIAGITGDVTVQFNSNVEWNLLLSDTKATPDWFDVNPKSGGAGSATLKVSIKRDNETYSDRNAYIIIKAGDVSKTLPVTQKKKNAIILSKDKFEVEEAGGQITIDLKSNVDYTATVSNESSSWISKITKSKSLTDSKEEFLVEAASVEGAREGRIFFAFGELRDTVYIYQQQKNKLVLGQDTMKVDNNEHRIEVDLSYNVVYNIIIPDNCDWVSLTNTKAVREDKIALFIKKNENYDGRSVKITVKDINSSLTDTLYIEQSQRNALILSEKVKSVRQAGETFSVELKSNVDYDVIMPLEADWITQLETKSLHTYNIGFNVGANKGEDNRKCEVIFKDKNSSLSDTLFVKQEGAVIENPYIKITSDEFYQPADGKIILVAKDGGIITFKVESNIGYELYTTAFDSTWIKEKSQTGNKHEFYIAKNTGQQMVMGAIYATNKNRNIADTLNIALLPDVDYYINIPKSSYTIPWRSKEPTMDEHVIFGKDYVSLDIKFSSNDLDFLDIDLINGGSWAFSSGYDDSESVNKTIHMEFDRNLSKTVRECKIIIKAGPAGEVTKEITIKQEPAPEGYPFTWDISLNPDQIKDIIRERDYLLVKNLRITGSLSDEDIDYISGFRTLETLDLGGTTITRLSLYGVNLEALRSVKLPDALQEIGMNCFRQCSNLQQIALPGSLIKIGQGAFARSGIRELVIPPSVKVIKGGAFEGSGLQRVKFMGESQLEEADNSFAAAYDLQSAEGISYIGHYMFYNCASLTRVVMSDNLTVMGDGAFGNCVLLETLSLPGKFKYFSWNETFRNCKALKSIYSYSNDMLSLGNYWNIIFEDVHASFTLYVTPTAYAKYAEAEQNAVYPTWFTGYMDRVKVIPE